MSDRASGTVGEAEITERHGMGVRESQDPVNATARQRKKRAM
jgi:hypothetical protein